VLVSIRIVLVKSSDFVQETQLVSYTKFMKFIAFILNLPWTILGMSVSVISIPTELTFRNYAVVIKVKSFWWYVWLPKMKGVRAMAIGNVVLLGSQTLSNDLEHELIHIEQAMRKPLIHPLLYWIETMRKGYKKNRYEIEAYGKAQNPHISGEWSFGTDDLADRVKDLVLSGHKIATTGFLKPTTMVPSVGEYAAILDRNGKRFCIIQYTDVEIKPFLQVDWDFAKLEGEDENIEQWRRGHREYFKKYYPNFTDEAEVVCSEFKLVKAFA
jgi:uncharacterized protein YhfF